jgi:hypothetical protein
MGKSLLESFTAGKRKNKDNEGKERRSFMLRVWCWKLALAVHVGFPVLSPAVTY